MYGDFEKILLLLLYCFLKLFLFSQRFHEEYKDVEYRKIEMAKAEKLFGLDFTLYPELVEVKEDLHSMDILYKFYNEQKVF